MQVAKTDVFVGFLSSKALERIMDRRPNVLLTLAKRLMGLLSPLILHIDSALEWQHVDAGEIIYRAGSAADSYYIVIQGRLRAINEKRSGGIEIISEYGQNDSVGELECITGEKRTATVHAIRDTELVRIPIALFNAIAARHPGITLQMTRALAKRVRSDASGGLKAVGASPATDSVRNSNLNLKVRLVES